MSSPHEDQTPPCCRRSTCASTSPVRGTRARKVVHAVDDVNLELYRGRVVALVGESGSGKSTIARLLAQLMPVTGGQILLHGAGRHGARTARRSTATCAGSR